MAEDSVSRLQDLARRSAAQDSSSSAAVEPGQPAQQGPRAELQRVRAEIGTLRLRYRDGYSEIQALLRKQAALEKAVTEEAAASAGDTPASNDKRVSTAMAVTNSDPTLVTEKEKVASLKSQIALTDREIGDLEKRRERVLRDVGAVQSRMDKLPMREQQLASLTRDYEASKANYKSLLDKTLAAEMAANMERWQKAERFVMLDVARVPEKPTSPGDRP